MRSFGENLHWSYVPGRKKSWRVFLQKFPRYLDFWGQRWLLGHFLRYREAKKSHFRPFALMARENFFQNICTPIPCIRAKYFGVIVITYGDILNNFWQFFFPVTVEDLGWMKLAPQAKIFRTFTSGVLQLTAPPPSTIR